WRAAILLLLLLPRRERKGGRARGCGRSRSCSSRRRKRRGRILWTQGSATTTPSKAITSSPASNTLRSTSTWSHLLVQCTILIGSSQKRGSSSVTRQTLSRSISFPPTMDIYPLNVYGTIIARDSLDRQRVYLFQRANDDCQNISSKNDALVLTGPKRGLMICDSIIFEVDLKVKDANGRKVKDERVSRGLMEINGIKRLSYPPKYQVQTEKLVSMHSTLDLNYTFVRNAVEGTVEARILEGPVDFHGKIVARTSSFPCDIMLHDSELAGMLTAGDGGILQTARRVVSVSIDEALLLTVAAATSGAGTVEFTPKRGHYDEEKITCGNYKMLVKVTWSIVCW
uniref:DUF6598 domain-containing protein n=1 Tax=Aegilops tauschii subsp. strangulata TaxID=200361 RepID=A0A453A8N4_AEGTS